MKKDLTQIEKPFGLLDEHEQKELMNWPHGWEIYTNIGWVPMDDPTWVKRMAYRAKPAPKTKPQINWDHVSSEYNWLATDESGKSYLYKIKPYLSNEIWDLSGEIWVPGDPFILGAESHESFKMGTCNWRESLVKRPGYEGE